MRPLRSTLCFIFGCTLTLALSTPAYCNWQPTGTLNDAVALGQSARTTKLITPNAANSITHGTFRAPVVNPATVQAENEAVTDAGTVRGTGFKTAANAPIKWPHPLPHGSCITKGANGKLVVDKSACQQ